MEELREKAVSYSDENVLDVIKEAFSKVYADGYRDGYNDCKEEIPVDLRKVLNKYVDLGLPSGTLWAVGYETDKDGELLFMPFEKASVYRIPTEEQWKELLDYCRFDFNYSSSGLSFYGVTCIGPNGNAVKFRSEGYMVDTKLVQKNVSYGGGGSVFFWINDKDNAAEKKAVVILPGTKSIQNSGLANVFSGFKLPIRLVKLKQ